MKQLSVVKGSSFLDSTAISARVYAIVLLAERSALSMKETLAVWAGRVHGRKDLARLTVRQLEDIGLEPFQAQAEINKPFWKK